ncbi:MAG TPA: hypothetical protein VKS01_05420 [Bryobacteraceae bacterium]|nr:hypothetical protein [Bryobacteraceae bacterium]
MKKLIVSFATLALGIASAASHSFTMTITHATFVGNTQLNAGDYKVQPEGDKIAIKVGKSVVDVPAKVETADKKFDSTTIRINDKTQKIEEIHVGGTNMRIVFPGVNAD